MKQKVFPRNKLKIPNSRGEKMDDYGRIIEFLPNLRDFPWCRIRARKKAHNLLLSCWISSRSKISVRTENNSLKEVHTPWSSQGKGLLIELNCRWCTVQLGRPVTIPRATTWGVLWSGPVGDFRGRGRGKSKITSLCFCEVHHFSHGWQGDGGLRTFGKALLKHVLATCRASRN